jgi:hypothetical protein
VLDCQEDRENNGDLADDSASVRAEEVGVVTDSDEGLPFPDDRPALPGGLPPPLRVLVGYLVGSPNGDGGISDVSASSACYTSRGQ